MFHRPPRSSRLDTVDVMSEPRIADRPLEIRIDNDAAVPPPSMLPWCVDRGHNRQSHACMGVMALWPLVRVLPRAPLHDVRGFGRPARSDEFGTHTCDHLIRSSSAASVRDRAFPWDVAAGPPPTVETSTMVTDFSSDRSVRDILAARIQDGFILDSVSLNRTDGKVRDRISAWCRGWANDIPLTASERPHASGARWRRFT